MYEILDFFKRNKYHFIGWVVFIAYEVGIVGFVTGSFGPLSRYLILYFLSILFFYTYALIILPFALKPQKGNIIVLLLLIVVGCIVYASITWVLLLMFFDHESVDLKSFIKLVWKYFYFLGLSSTYYLFRRLKFENARKMTLEKARYDRIIKRKNIEYELVKSNYAYLRAQINPHFLFNLLHFLHDKAKRISIRAADAMRIFSEMMEYSLRTTDKGECVSVSEELKQVKNLIYLNQLRFDNKLRIDLSYSKEGLDLQIIPLVLLTLVENMFKHGDLVSRDKGGSIHVYVENDGFHVTTVNALAVKRNNMVTYKAGLDNIRKRLELAYNGVSSFKCLVENNSFFSTHISIPVRSLTTSSRIATQESDRDDGNNFSGNKNKIHWTNQVLVFFKRNIYHFIGWPVFIAYEICLLAFVNGKFGNLESYSLYYPLHILLFYWHALIVLPYSRKRSRYKIIVLCFMIILESIAYTVSALILMPLIARFFDLQIESLGKFDFKLWIQITWRFLYFVGFSWTYYLFRRFIQKNKQNLELERVRFQDIIKQKDIEQELIRSNYAYLRAQINPHFLFNVLNFLYDETKKSSKEVSEAIMTLSEMMQYSLGGLQQEFVVITEEIEQVEHLIYLHQLQLDYTLQIDFNYSDEVVHLEIIPLVLLTLVENIFKHGNLTAPDKRASINLYIENNVFHIVTVNNLRTGEFGFRHSTGLDNIRKRLAFTYNGTENVEFSEDEHHRFVARIEIPVLSLMNPKRISIKA